MSEVKGIKEMYSQFFEEPTRKKLKEILEGSFGETDHMEFKSAWIEKSDLAKKILSIANSNGGAIIIGVDEVNGELEAKGIITIKDNADFNKEIEKFIPKKLLKNIELINFIYKDSVYGKVDGKSYQVILVKCDEKYLPYICESDGSSTNKGDIYVRRGTSTQKATYEELQEIINLRINTEYSNSDEFELENELEELKVLYHEIPQYKSFFEGLEVESLLGGMQSKNKNYPEEDYEEFIADMIKAKKEKIKELII